MSDAVRGSFLSSGGQTIETRLWLPTGEPRAVVQLVHGMAEHIDRYEWVAGRFCEAGFAVVGHTQLGHGPNAKTLGYFGATGGWDALIADVHALRLETEKRFPDAPYFLLGHSMGSFVTRTYCLKHEKGLRGVVLSGTGHFEKGVVSAGLAISRLLCALGMGKKPSKLLQKVTGAGNLKEIDAPRTAFDWLSTDDTVVDRYIADPYCGFPFTARGYGDMFEGISRMAPENLSAMDKDIPVLLISGAKDPVGAHGAGVKATAKELEDAGVKDVTAILYENGRHEMFNEVEREAVCNDVVYWMEKQL